MKRTAHTIEGAAQNAKLEAFFGFGKTGPNELRQRTRLSADKVMVASRCVSHDGWSRVLKNIS